MRPRDRDRFKPWPNASDGAGRNSAIAGGQRSVGGSASNAGPPLPADLTASADLPGASDISRENLERLLKPMEAAHVLGVTVKQMALWRSRGGGPRFVRVSHKVVMYRHQALIEWAREREFGSAHEARLRKI